MNRLKQCRIDAGLSQQYVAVTLGVKGPSVSNWESGKTSPTVENLVALAKLYGVSTDYLLGNDQPNNGGKDKDNSYTLERLETLPEETPPGYVRGKIEFPADSMAIAALRDFIRQVIREELERKSV